MKATLRYLLIVTMLSVASLVFATTQSLAQQPEVQMHSTSILQGSGSTLPQAAVEGVSTTSMPSQEASHQSKQVRKGRPGDWDDPYKDPLGDAAWPLMVLAVGYVCVRGMRRRVED